MRLPNTTPKRFAICFHPQADDSIHSLLSEVEACLRANGISTIFEASTDDARLRQLVEGGSFDVLIALGGDGTMLRAGHLCAPYRLPILGINIGRFGFLTEVKDGQWTQAISRLLVGDFRLEDRMMLRVEHWRATKLLATWDALNELVVCRGSEVRPIHIDASVDGQLLTHLIADGLILATPTGSTAYALAAGGPIMPPELLNLLLIPVAPHLSMDRAIILSQGACVRITAHSTHQVVLSVDGQTPVEVCPQDVLQAFAGDNVVSFIRFQDPGYFYRNLMLYMERNPSGGNKI